jgi:DNA-binding NarL/FixJ family response regulator
MIRLLVVENQSSIRRGLQMWLRLAPDMTVVGEADDAISALWQASMLHPDVILVHIDSKEIDGGKFIKAMRSASPGSAVVVLSLYDDSMTRWRALGAGAAAFVSMHEYGDRLLQAIRQAAGALQPETQNANGVRISPAPKDSPQV